MNRISLNIDGKRVPDRAYLTEFLTELKPSSVGVMDDLGYAMRLKELLPDTIVWHRAYGDSEAHLNRDPAQLAARYANEGYASSGVYAYGCNEPSPNDRISWRGIAEWGAMFLNECRARNVRAVGLNLPPGSIEHSDILSGAFDVYLRALHDHAGFHVAGEHDYTGFLLPWGGGWGGRSPDDFQFKERLQPDRWTRADEIFPDASYHLMRGVRLDDRSMQLGLKVPRKLVTEFGWDRMPDWEKRAFNPYAWATGRYGTSGYKLIRGVNSYRAVWADWFPFWHFEEAIYQQLLWADKVYPAHYIGFNLFQWCPGTEDWDIDFGFDYSRHKGLHNALKVKVPVPTPKPTTPRKLAVVARIPADFVNIRAEPTTAGADRGDLFLGQEVHYYPDSPVNGWVYVEAAPVEGWVSLQDGKVAFESPIIMPSPPVTLAASHVSQCGTGTKNNCLEAALTAVLRYLRLDAKLADVIAAFGAPGSFSTLQTAVNVALANYGVVLHVKTNQNLSTLVNEITEKRPAILLVTRGKLPDVNRGCAPTFKGAHFITVYGYNESRILYHDPLDLPDFEGTRVVSPAVLLEAWATTPGNSGKFQALYLDKAEAPQPPPDEANDLIRSLRADLARMLDRIDTYLEGVARE